MSLHPISFDQSTLPSCWRILRAVSVGTLALFTVPASAADVLVVDRLSHSVYRYSSTGTLLGTVVTQSDDIHSPTGIAISPDYRQLYISSSQRNRVMRYDYDPATGVATNPTIFADPDDELAFPNDIQFSPQGNIIYVSNLNGGVSRFYRDGSSAGPKLMLPTPDEAFPTPTASLNFAPSGELLAGAFQDLSGAAGGIAKFDLSTSESAEFLVEPTTEIRGATGLMIHDDFLYVTGLFSGKLRRFALTDRPGLNEGQMDLTWEVSGLPYPQDVALAPDGNGFLLGILGIASGAGKISRYAFDGTFLNSFADAGQGGFTEATAFVTVPDPPTGDFNGDGVVDGADYVVWRHASPSDLLLNDDTPGSVDITDYADWRANFGKIGPASTPGLGAAIVPEPAAAGFMFVILSCFCLSRLRR